MRSRSFDGYFFDLDGTLIHSGRAFEQALYDLGWIKSPLDTYGNYLAGVDTKALLQYVLEIPAGQLDVHNDFINHYEKNLIHYSFYYDHVAECLTQLKAHGKSLAIISNKPDKLCQEIAERFPVKFDFVLGAGVLSVKKPDPAPLLHAAEALGLAPSQVVYIGDMPTDLEASERAKMHGIYAAYGLYRYKDPDFKHIHQIEGLLELIPQQYAS